mmetsp:Transcript_22628/g.27744  ORF Transcript_22628/g.27744 Transcript_22628/m.27744 type:complete len:800 (-) Transcript_22628:122-2521(-)
MKSSILKILYKYLGPSTIHLQHEIALLVILMVLTIASFYSMYHSNKRVFAATIDGKLTTANKSDYNCYLQECTYVLLSTLWLGRHLLHRIICTTEVNTTTISTKFQRKNHRLQYHPTWLSELNKFWIWISSGGQYYDIPTFPIQVKLYECPSSKTLDRATATGASKGSNSKQINKKILNILRSSKSKSSVVDRHQMEALSNTSIPPLHRTYIVQIFIIIPFIVIPISALKYLKNKLSSRKLISYYDSDDEGDVIKNENTHRRPSDIASGTTHNITSNNISSGNHNLYHYDDSDHENEVYAKLYSKTQFEINAKLDILWNHIPSPQLIICILTLAIVLYLGINFYSVARMPSYYNNSGHPRIAKPSVNRENRNHNNAIPNNMMTQQQQIQQHQQQNRFSFNLGQGLDMSPTSLNAQLMAQTFEMKQSKVSSGVNVDASLSKLRFIYRLKVWLKSKLRFGDWKTIFYSPWGMMYMMSVWGIVASLCIFGRIMLPLPDLVAGGVDSMWNGRGSSKYHKLKRKDKPWSETYMTITTGKFFLYSRSIFIRIIENLIVCAILPQSSYICKATGHCTLDQMIFEMNAPPTVVLTSNSVHGRGRDMFDNLIQDRFVGFIIAISVLVLSAAVLICQIVSLDKGSVSFEAYNFIHAKNASNNTGRSISDGHNHKKGRRTSASNSSGNGSDGLYNFGDNNGTSGSGNFDSSNKKEKIFHEIKIYVYKIFASELGASSSSPIIAFMFLVFVIHSMIIIMFATYYFMVGMDWFPLVLLLIAVFTAAVGTDIDSADFDELESIAKEINAAHGM